MASTARSLLDKLRQYDAYPKTLEDFQVKTYCGAAGEFDYCDILLNLYIINFSLFYRYEQHLQSSLNHKL